MTSVAHSSHHRHRKVSIAHQKWRLTIAHRQLREKDNWIILARKNERQKFTRMLENFALADR